MENEYKSFFKTVGNGEGERCHYPTRLDTYGKGCQHDCLSGETLILMYDGTTKKMKDIKVGDEIYGVYHDGKYHKYTKAVVLAHWETGKKETYKVTLENGTSFICSGNHRWLTDRGWKYTTGDMGKTDNQRPYLTTNNKLRGFGSCIDTSLYEETDDYKKGYLSGIIRGDGHLGIHDYSGKRREKEIQFHFRLTLKCREGVERTKRYLSYFGIETNAFDFPMKARKTKEEILCKGIRTHKKSDYYMIKELIEYKDTKEYLRGFLAGLYDAEGTKDKLVKRVYNSEDKIIETYIKGLEEFGFKYKFDKPKKTVNKEVKTIRLIGDLSETLRFLQITNPAIREKFNFQDVAIKNGRNLKVKSIEYIGIKELYDITTTTENFIANGLVSHNCNYCYAKSLLDFRGLWNPQNPAIADIEKIRKKVKKLEAGSTVRLGGMTDCFMPQEIHFRNTYETIKALNEQGVHYLIVTKSNIVARPEYLEIMDKDLAHIQVSITSTDDEKSLTFEKAIVPSKRIEAVETLQKHGFDVAVRLSPYMPEYVNTDVINAIQCDKIVVEFLRVNSWIKKWFDIDYSQYTLKEGGYQHLPLERKLELISKITGFKEITVCEDVTEHYHYWEENVNANPLDCCNLRK